MVIRKLNINDKDKLEKLIKLIETNLENQYYWLPINEQSRKHFFDDEWTYFLGLFNNEDLVGASALFFNKNEYGSTISNLSQNLGKVAEIGRCMVAPKYRNHNYLLRLNSELLHIAKEKGINSVIATVHPNNKPSLKSFLKLDFKILKSIIKLNNYERYILCLSIK